MIVRVVESRPCAVDAPLLGHIGEDADGSRWGWIAPHDPKGDVAVPPSRLIRIPPALSIEQAQTALANWPAWTLAILGAVGLGTRVLVSGGDWLARRVLEIAPLRGCAWTASHAATNERLTSDYRLPLDVSLSLALSRRQLPDRPDVMILTRGRSAEIAEALTVCRSGGRVVIAGDDWHPVDLSFYPDVHRRGLRLVFADVVDAARSLPDVHHAFAGLARRLAMIPAGGAAAPPE